MYILDQQVALERFHLGVAYLYYLLWQQGFICWKFQIGKAYLRNIKWFAVDSEKL